MKLLRFVSEGAVFPPWYGFAWHDYTRAGCYALPVGLNVLARGLRALYLVVRVGHVPVQADGRDGYYQGRKALINAWDTNVLQIALVWDEAIERGDDQARRLAEAELRLATTMFREQNRRGLPC